MKLTLIFLGTIFLICTSVSARHGPRRKVHSMHQTKVAAPATAREDFSNKAAVARQLMHDSKYVALATQNTKPGFKGFAGANVQLVTDGPDDNPTGIPYTYMAKNDATVADLMKSEKAAILLSQGVIDGSCRSMPLENKDVACPRAELLGEMRRVKNDTDEYTFAWNALKAKFPAMENFDPNEYDVGKMFIKAVLVRGNDGRAQELPVREYFKAENAPKIG